MRAAGRHTAPPGDPQAGPTAASRPGFHLADPATAARHATSPPRRPGNRRPPVMPPFSIQAQPLPHGAGGPHAKQTVVSRPRRPSTAKRGRGDSRKGPQLAGVAEGRGAIGSARSRIRQDCERQGPQPESRRVTGHSRKGPQLAGPAIGRGRSWRGRRGEGLRKGGVQSEVPAAVSGRDPQGVRRSFFAGFVPFASLNIRFERVQTASQPYFCSRKRFTPRPHTHQIQPVAAPRQRSAPAGGSRDRHPLRLEDFLPFRPSVRHPETHGSGCRFVGS